MLEISIQNTEFYDEENEQLVTVNPVTLTLEHSLLSISKWESKWNKPFFSDADKNSDELIDYLKCMIVTPKNYDDRVIDALCKDDLSKIVDYIKAPMTATTFSIHGNAPKKTQVITSELIYYWMVAYNIPFECEKWHINRLLTLIRICDIKNNPKKGKMSKRETVDYYKRLNDARRSSIGTKG